MTFDVQSVDLDKLADAVATGGIDALEKLAADGGGIETKTTEEQPGEGGETKPTETSGKTEAPGETDKPTEDAGKTGDQANQDQEHGTAVSTKDGKGTIPYAVLKGARDRASHFEQENATLRQQVEQLTKQSISGSQQQAQAAQEQAIQATHKVDDQIVALRDKAAQLKEDFPELAEMFEGQVTALELTRQQLLATQNQLETERNQRAAETEAQAADAVQEAIDGNSVLALWQSKGGREWQVAVDMDTMLRQQPEWRDKTFAERFAKVATAVQALHPEFEVPKSETPTKETKDLPAPAPTSTKQESQAAASGKPPINSLSDLPGGSAPANGQLEQLGEMSTAAIGNKFMNMNPEQVADYLATLSL